MRLYKVKDYQEMSRRAAALLSAQIVAKPDTVLGLATGSTPVGTYEYLVSWYQAGILDFSKVRVVNLDEYRGISRDDEQSYYYFMKKHLFDHVNIRPENTHIPDGRGEDAGAVTREYESLVRSLGGADLQLLGIGRNGHIGFNEPGDSFPEICHCVALTESTIEANKRFFAREEDMPREAYTMGIGTIMGAKKIVLLASGEDKAKALYGALEGPITPRLPASVLRLHHDVTVIADEAALSLVTN
ncbi:MAG: glucosamine-6-phosphate deaminase [Clostridiales bacterium]|nr:glucosamine-6-phosphate deaminase [Clostridiales bacterium]